MTLRRVVMTAGALWLGSRLISGIGLSPQLDPLAAIGTLLVVSLILGVLQGLTLGVRRTAVALCDPLPVAVVVGMLANAAVFWVAGRVAGVIGLGYTVNGLTAALFGSLILVTVGWLSTYDL
jgi:uncharacterized membrane protein YvlD (DUF360 family)